MEKGRNMKFYGYFRSSAAYRCRIALNLKGLTPEHRYLNLRTGEVGSEWYTSLNPQRLVPTLEEDGLVLSQSLAIIEYLDEVHPEPPLLPGDAAGRARVRQLSQIVACDIHPLNNLRVLTYLTRDLGVDDAAKNAWYLYWVTLGFEALEQLLASDPKTGVFCHGDSVTMADLCLVPQVFNARRFEVDLDPYPTIRRIDAACNEISAFVEAAPDVQPDSA